MLSTYEGVVQQGRIRLPASVVMPEGARVYVTIVPGLDERAARRRANAWLGERVGDKVMADEARLVRAGERQVWHFGAVVTFTSREPFGPIGYVDVEAASGDILSSDAEAEEMIQRGERLERAPLFPVG